MTNREIFCKNFRRFLDEQGIMQIDVAKYVGKPKSTVNKWYMGKSYPRPEEIEKLAEFFKVNVERLLCDITEDESLILCAYRRVIDGVEDEDVKTTILDTVLGSINFFAK